MRISIGQALNRRAHLLAAIAASCMLAAPAAYAVFPEKPVRLVVPFSPGGGTDIVARSLGAEMSKDLGQPVIVENKPGAGTIIGTDAVAKSAPDGYTMVVSTVAHSVNPSLMAKMPYSTEKDFAPVILIARSPNILVVRADSPYKSVKDILAAAKASPGKLTYASNGIGTSAHLSGELLKHLAKVDLVHVPYRGAGPVITDLLGGQIDIYFSTAAAVGGHIDSGKLRALAVTSAERSAGHPDVPTVAEAGVPGFQFDGWYALFAPAGTPPAIVARLNASAKKAAQSKYFRDKVQPEGLIISAGSPEDLDRFIRAEIPKWATIIKASGITPQ